MEFVEVMKHKQRMCNSVGVCWHCPLFTNNNGSNIICEEFIRTYPEKAEEIIMKWAEKHPIKTNKDKFDEIFSDFPVDIERMTEQCKYDCPNYPNCYGCNRKEAIEFWDKEYEEVNKDESSN
jgi:hypothetical protein